MKTVLFEAENLLSESDRSYTKRYGGESLRWYKQVPETEAEEIILTYAIEGMLGGDMKVSLKNERNKECHAIFSLIGWNDEKGSLRGNIKVTHVLSSDEQNILREQIKKRGIENLRPGTNITQPLLISSYPIPFNNGSSFAPRVIEEKYPVYFSILLLLEKGKMDGFWQIRILVEVPDSSSGFDTEATDIPSHASSFWLPPNHFHYHKPFRSHDLDAEMLDDITSDEEDRGDTYEHWFESLSDDARNNLDMND